MERAVHVLCIQHALHDLRRVRDRHHDCAADEIGESREHRVRNDRPPILADKMYRFSAAQRSDQLGDIGRKRGFIVVAIVRNLGRRIPAQAGSDSAEAGGRQRRNLVAPGSGRVGKTVQQDDQRPVPCFNIGKFSPFARMRFMGSACRR